MTISTETNTIDEITQLDGELEGLYKKSIAATIRIGELLTKHSFRFETITSGVQPEINARCPVGEKMVFKYVSNLSEAYRLLAGELRVKMSNANRREELAAAEQVLEGTLRCMDALLVIRDEQLYRDEFDTFEEYLLNRWNMTGTEFERRLRWYSDFALLNKARARLWPSWNAQWRGNSCRTRSASAFATEGVGAD